MVQVGLLGVLLIFCGVWLLAGWSTTAPRLLRVLLVFFAVTTGLTAYALITKPSILDNVSLLSDVDGKKLYDLTILKTGWYDTGLWVREGQIIDVSTEKNSSKQPFVLRLNGQELQAGLNAEGLFVAQIRGVDSKEASKNWPSPQVIAVEGGKKLYVRLADEAKEDVLTLRVVIMEDK
jgi:hypothetical protein